MSPSKNIRSPVSAHFRMCPILVREVDEGAVPLVNSRSVNGWKIDLMASDASDFGLPCRCEQFMLTPEGVVGSFPSSVVSTSMFFLRVNFIKDNDILKAHR